MEALEAHGDGSWEEVAAQVGKSVEECIGHFLALPIEEPYAQRPTPVGARHRDFAGALLASAVVGRLNLRREIWHSRETPPEMGRQPPPRQKKGETKKAKNRERTAEGRKAVGSETWQVRSLLALLWVG